MLAAFALTDASSSDRTKILVVIGVIVAAVITVRVLRALTTRWYWRRMQRISPEAHADLRRSKRQQTVVTLLESFVRYGVYGCAVIVIIGVVTGDAPTAALGASLLVVILGLSAQKVMGDMLSGMLLLFEDQFAVGDYLEITSPAAAGIVEEVTLRTTTLRAFNGDRIVVLNGAITAFNKVCDGYLDLRVECVVADAERFKPLFASVVQQVSEFAGRRLLAEPELDNVVPFASGTGAHVVIRALAPPTLDWIVRDNFVAALRAALGDDLIGDIHVSNVRPATFEQYRRNVLVS